MANDTQHAQEFLMHFPHRHRSSNFTAYRNRDWKLIKHYQKPAEKAHELFNLKTDPYEKNNLAQSNPKQLKKTKAQMQKALTKSKAQFPEKELSPY